MSSILRAALLFLIPAAAQIPQFIFLDDARDAATNQRGIAPGSMFIIRGSFSVPLGLRTAPIRCPPPSVGFR